MEHDETGCQAAPEGPILCVNNCGFFGSPANMNMCSKCYKDTALKQEQAKAAASSIEDIVNGSSSAAAEKEPTIVENGPTGSVEIKVKAIISSPSLDAPKPTEVVEPKTAKAGGPSRCTTCKKRVGLTGFKCRCGDVFCSEHRYSDRHDCSYDYKAAGREAIARENPVVRAAKLVKV
ncbi:zinc finger a20 and an1 domain-containing stress-associated protein 8 [Phtheirospermum japonicum]|uniref:Zinc finger a20 and an1 domain-containing stress-associated protein 8 n=1 Tax=Phtheirospermum japonicum TaxID=374723 RepID=A0A830B5Z4_9LAMI|nr:zinc finger a20 and an1 domain-containing stress-associated protein 8 [Phtheirospermum japonicum]